ncbi:MAG: hypothetical protein AB1742_02875 [bacterium]
MNVNILDWTIVPLALAAAVYYLYGRFRGTAARRARCACSGCDAADDCAERGENFRAAHRTGE